MIPCELDPTSNPFRDTTTLIYEIELPSAGKQIGLNLLGGEYFTIPYVIYKIPNSPSVNQPPTQAKKNALIIDINGEDNITPQGDLDEIHHHQT